MFFGQHFPKSEASSKGLRIGDMFKDVGILGAAIVCYLLALFFASGSPGFHRQDLDAPRYIGYAIGAVLLVAVAVINELLDRFLVPFRPLRRACAGRGGRARDGRLDPEHHRKHSYPERREDPLRLHLPVDVQPAILRAFHREEPDASPGRAAPHLFGARVRRAEHGERHSNIHGSDGCAGGLCDRQNLFLANDARGGQRPVPTNRRGRHLDHRRHRDDVGRASGRPGLGYAKDRFTAEELQKSNPALYDNTQAEKPSRSSSLGRLWTRREQALSGAENADARTTA